MGRVLVRKAEGDRKRGNLPKPLSEMTDEEREKFGLPSRSAQRRGDALNIRGRKGVTNIPQAPRAEPGKGRTTGDRVTDIPEALQMNPKTGAVRVRDRSPIEYSPEEMAEIEERLARRQEELGPALRGRQREAFEETDEDEREKRDIGASFRAGLDARRTIMQGQEDPKTGERRQKGFISENIQAGDEGAGLGNIGQVFDPSGTHPYFRSKQGPRDEIPVPRLLNRFLSSEPERFQAMFGADPNTVMSLGRSGRGSDEMRQMLIAQALSSIREDPAKFQQFLNTQGLELSVDDTSMGALGSTQADLSDIDSVNELARSLRLSGPQAVMFQQLNDLLAEQGLRLPVETQRGFVGAGTGETERGVNIGAGLAAAQPKNFAEVGPMLEQILPMAMQQATPITTTTAGIAPELVGRGKEISIDAPEQRPAPQERDPMVTAQQRMNLQIQGAFDNLVRQGQASPEMLGEFQSAVMQSIANQAAQVSDMRRQMAEAEIARNPLARTRVDIQQALAGDMDEQLMSRMASEAMSNALEQATVRGEGGEFLSEMDQIYGDRAFAAMDASRRAAEQQSAMGTAGLKLENNNLKRRLYEMRQVPVIDREGSPEEYEQEMASIQRQIDENQAEIDAQSFETTGIRPVDAESRASMDELSPEAKRTEYAFRTGQNIPVAGSDVQNPRRGQPVQIPGMGGEQSDSRLDRTIPESQDEIRGRRRRAKGMRESGAPIRGAPDFTSMTQEELEQMLMSGGDAPAPAATAESAVPPANMNFLERLRAGLDNDDNVETGQWMSVGEQLLKGIQDDMTQRILKSATRIPDDLRAGQFDSPAEQERKEAAVRRLQEEAYENNPRVIQRREERKKQTMAEMDEQAKEFERFYGGKVPERTDPMRRRMNEPRTGPAAGNA